MKCLMCDHPADIDGFCEGCYDDLHNGGKSDAIKVVNRLLAINAKQAAELAEATTLLEQADKRIDELTSAVQQRSQGLLYRNTRINELEQRITELERQLGATLTTSEAAAWCNQCNLPAEHCRENHDGALYAKGCAP